MRTLVAEILNDQTVAPVSFSPLTQREPFGAEIEVSIYLHPCDRGLGLAVIKFGTCKLTPLASDAFRRICNDNPIGLIHDDQGL
jgi:hypothetical protein